MKFYYISHTAKKDLYTDVEFKQAAESLGLEFILIDPETALVSVDEKNENVLIDGKRLDVEPHSLVYVKSMKNIAHIIYKILRNKGCTGVQLLDDASKRIGREKLASYVDYSYGNVAIPKTLLIENIKQFDNAVTFFGNTFPLIVKKSLGTKGVGVFLAESKKGLKSLLEYLLKKETEILIQEYIKTSESKDIRAIVLNGEVIAAVQRSNSKGDFRSNVAQGGQSLLVEMTDEQKQVAINALKAIDLDFGGVDLLYGENQMVVTEINVPCDFSFVQQTTGVNIATKILEYLIEKSQNKT